MTSKHFDVLLLLIRVSNQRPNNFLQISIHFHVKQKKKKPQQTKKKIALTSMTKKVKIDRESPPPPKKKCTAHY